MQRKSPSVWIEERTILFVSFLVALESFNAIDTTWETWNFAYQKNSFSYMQHIICLVMYKYSLTVY